ncbi:MAG: redoxin domain-containing protein [Alloprevotella sp.]|nr:redoxin domain-containing protein [Alloprevotella sp.]
MKRIFSSFVLLLTSLVALSCVDDNEIVASGDLLAVGDVLPPFSVVTTEGDVVTPETLAGRPCVIVFFNTGCGDCRRELPVVNRVFEEYAGQLGFICIARDEGTESVKAFWESQGLSLPVSPQTGRSVYDLFAERGIPRVYVCDAEGRIVTAFTERVGYRKLRKAVERMLP